MEQEQINQPTNDSSKGDINPVIIVGGLLLILIVVGGGAFAFRHQIKEMLMPTAATEAPVTTNTTSTTGTASPAAENSSNNSSDSGLMASAKVFSITAANFSFSLPEIKVKKGDNVKIVLNNSEGMHDFVIDEFNAKTKRIPAGQTDTVAFIANKTGTFEYYCSVGNHRAMGMRGNLIVE